MIAHPAIRRSQDGFTLIEVLVALTILSIGLAALFGAFSQSMASARQAQLSMQARTLAQATLERSLTARSLEPGTQEGIAPDGLRWRLSIARDTQPASSLRPVRVVVTVTWSAGGRLHDLSLSALRFVRKKALS